MSFVQGQLKYGAPLGRLRQYPVCFQVINMATFKEIPDLDLSLANEPSTKPQLLKGLRDALMEVGFFYIRNCSIDEAVIERACEQCKEFFEIPQELKDECDMINTPSFFGYSAVRI